MNTKEKLTILGMVVWMVSFLAHYFVATRYNSIVYAITTIPCMMMFMAFFFTKSE